MTNYNNQNDYKTGVISCVISCVISLVIMIIFIITTNNISSTSAATCNITAQRNFAESHWTLDTISIGLLILSAISALSKDTNFYAAQFLILFVTRTVSLIFIFKLRNQDKTVINFELHRCPGEYDVLVKTQDVCIYILQVIAFIWIVVLSVFCIILIFLLCCFGREVFIDKCKKSISRDHNKEEHTARKIGFVSNTIRNNPRVDSEV